MKLLITLVGLVFILEGLPYLAFPESMQKWLRQLTEIEPKSLRILGVVAVAIGLSLCYLTQRTDLFD